MTTDDRTDSPLSREHVELLRGDAPDPRDVERAYRRFAIHRDVSPLPLRAGRFLVLGLVVGWGVVFAATGEPFPGYRAHEQPNAASSSAPKAKPKRASPPAPAPSVVPLVEPPAPTASAAARGPTAFSLPPEESAPDPKWQRAARALREHEYAEARAALDELEQSRNPSDAEAASLALAQVYVAQGRGQDARSRLDRLARSARSRLVREKARALLFEIDAGDRSPAAPAATEGL